MIRARRQQATVPHHVPAAATTQLISHTEARQFKTGDAIAAIELPPGYRLEVVASEPMIHEPAVVAWDGNGRPLAGLAWRSS